MNPFEFVIAILAIVFGYRLFSMRMRHRDAQRAPDTQQIAWQQRLDQLEERVKVLERIVTDDKYDLKRQIEELNR
jgi:hypothetical protein